MLRLALLAVLLPAAGCQSAAPVDAFPPLLTGSAAEPSPEYEAALELWEGAGPEAYAMTLQRICFCPSPDYTGPFQVAVRDGAVARVSLDGVAVDSDRGVSVDGLFALIGEAYAQGAEVVDVSYDPELGYPTAINIDYSSQMADEEIGYLVSDLAATGR